MVRGRIRLRSIGPQLEGNFWESEKQLRIGRLETLEVVLGDSSISRRHAEVMLTTQGWVVRDLGSTNGTFLNGVRVGRADQRVKARDVLQCGNLVMQVAVLEEEQAERVPAPTPAPVNGKGAGVFLEDGKMEVQATTSHTWEQALSRSFEQFLGGPAEPDPSRPRAGDRTMTLLRTSHHLGHIASLDELLRSILDDAVAALDAQRGAIVLMDERTNQLHLRAVASGDRDPGGRVVFSRTLAQSAFARGESMLCRDVNADMSVSIAEGAMSSVLCVLLRSPRKRLGVLHLDRGALQEPFSVDDLHFADAIAASVSAGIESAQLLEKQRELFIHTVTALAQAVEMRDEYTGGHTQRVTDFAVMLAEEIQVTPAEKHCIQVGTPLHDIGKIGINDAILRKPGKLTPEEFEEMKTHTVKGHAILRAIPDLAFVIPIVRSHHERWDGKGYPDGLAGEKTPRVARIVAVADAFDAMTSDRPYRRGMPAEKAFAQVREYAGIQFDPTFAEAFLRLRPRIEELMRHRDIISDTVFPDLQINLVSAQPA